jgi:DNA-binding transcriptional MerR regulator
MPQHSYTISQLAKEFGITTRTIRFYEEKGLLAPHRNGKQRIYSNADRVHLTLILRGKRLGFSLDESRELIDRYNPDHGNVEQLRHLLRKIDEKEAQLQNQLHDISAMQQDLADVRRRAQQALRASPPQETT